VSFLGIIQLSLPDRANLHWLLTYSLKNVVIRIGNFGVMSIKQSNSSIEQLKGYGQTNARYARLAKIRSLIEKSTSYDDQIKSIYLSN
jgi:hypothetical protein